MGKKREIAEGTRIDKIVQLGIIDKSLYKGLDERQSEAGFDFDEIFVISTNEPDREGDIIEQVWRLQNYNQESKGEKCGPVLFNHKSLDLPVGKGYAWLEDGKLMSGVMFAKDIDTYEIGKTVAELVRQNFLKNASVGMLPHSYEKTGETAQGWPTYRFTDNELLEWSVVNVPANPDAIRRMIGKGFDVNRLEKAGIVELDEATKQMSKDMQTLQKQLSEALDDLQKEKDINEARKEPLKAYRKHLKLFRDIMELESLDDELKSIDQTFGILLEKFNSTSEETLSDNETRFELTYTEDSEVGKALKNLA